MRTNLELDFKIFQSSINFSQFQDLTVKRHRMCLNINKFKILKIIPNYASVSCNKYPSGYCIKQNVFNTVIFQTTKTLNQAKLLIHFALSKCQNFKYCRHNHIRALYYNVPNACESFVNKEDTRVNHESFVDK